ncbi:hypothetical protein BESB_017860 [Besnoitia besnoiti]|uniref:Uncharacterized protein n=1 Tax=Besnoitia besnoiti TaxID=94643 RepID=A0A2A9M1U2_BESBE|nr:hypothetical protein BESB_017860 [Besnoitia besnoiti]PFH32468.1 hypothetical protein BESB_017860 [Besnoitia besnoiti]
MQSCEWSSKKTRVWKCVVWVPEEQLNLVATHAELRSASSRGSPSMSKLDGLRRSRVRGPLCLCVLVRSLNSKRTYAHHDKQACGLRGCPSQSACAAPQKQHQPVPDRRLACVFAARLPPSSSSLSSSAPEFSARSARPSRVSLPGCGGDFSLRGGLQLSTLSLSLPLLHLVLPRVSVSVPPSSILLQLRRRFVFPSLLAPCTHGADTAAPPHRGVSLLRGSSLVCRFLGRVFDSIPRPRLKPPLRRRKIDFLFPGEGQKSAVPRGIAAPDEGGQRRNLFAGDAEAKGGDSEGRSDEDVLRGRSAERRADKAPGQTGSWQDSERDRHPRRAGVEDSEPSGVAEDAQEDAGAASRPRCKRPCPSGAPAGDRQGEPHASFDSGDGGRAPCLGLSSSFFFAILQRHAYALGNWIAPAVGVDVHPASKRVNLVAEAIPSRFAVSPFFALPPAPFLPPVLSLVLLPSGLLLLSAGLDLAKSICHVPSLLLSPWQTSAARLLPARRPPPPPLASAVPSSRSRLSRSVALPACLLPRCEGSGLFGSRRLWFSSFFSLTDQRLARLSRFLQVQLKASVDLRTWLDTRKLAWKCVVFLGDIPPSYCFERDQTPMCSTLGDGASWIFSLSRRLLNRLSRTTPQQGNERGADADAAGSSPRGAAGLLSMRAQSDDACDRKPPNSFAKWLCDTQLAVSRPSLHTPLGDSVYTPDELDSDGDYPFRASQTFAIFSEAAGDSDAGAAPELSEASGGASTDRRESGGEMNQQARFHQQAREARNGSVARREGGGDRTRQDELAMEDVARAEGGGCRVRQPKRRTGKVFSLSVDGSVSFAPGNAALAFDVQRWCVARGTESAENPHRANPAKSPQVARHQSRETESAAPGKGETRTRVEAAVTESPPWGVILDVGTLRVCAKRAIFRIEFL